MSNQMIVIARIKLAAGKNEEDLLKASDRFQKEFVDMERGIIRRQLVRKSKNNGEYLDIVQFRSYDDFLYVMKKEMESDVCHNFFSIMDKEAEDQVEICQSIRTYDRKM